MGGGSVGPSKDELLPIMSACVYYRTSIYNYQIKTHTKPPLEMETCISTTASFKYVNSVAITITLPSLCLPADIAIIIVCYMKMGTKMVDFNIMKLCSLLNDITCNPSNLVPRLQYT